MWAITLISLEQHPEVIHFMSYWRASQEVIYYYSDAIETILQISSLTGLSLYEAKIFISVYIQY
jgi:hypothetical protein